MPTPTRPPRHVPVRAPEHPTPPTRDRRGAIPRIRPRVYLADGFAIGPGKVDLLRAIAEHRSISAAGRTMGMSYKRAWELVDAMNRGLGGPVVDTATGGRGGGGAELTDLGRAVIRHYDDLERRINAAVGGELEALQSLARRRHRTR